MAKMSAKNEEINMARMNAKLENKMAKVNAKHEEGKMVTEPRASHKLHSRSQRGKVERKEVKLPHLRKQKDKGTSHQWKDKTPRNNGNKLSNTYRGDERKIRGPPQMAKKEFEKGDEILLLSCYYPQLKDHTVVEDI